MLRIIGFIEKVGKHYQWIFNGEEPRLKIQIPQPRCEPLRRTRWIQLTEKQIIMEVYRRYSSKEALDSLVERIRQYYGQMNQRVKK